MERAMKTGHALAYTAAALVLFAIIAGCEKKSEHAEPAQSTETTDLGIDPIQSAIEEASIQQAKAVQPTDALLEKAQKMAKSALEEMLRKQAFLEDAYQRGEYETLAQYTFNAAGTGTPGVELWSGEEFNAYLRCDTAFRDLNLYASAMKSELSESNATARSILRKEKEDYLKSKAECEQFLALKPKEAWKEQDALYAKMRSE